jgi:Protein of unknown function (DUF3073)
MGRGRAKAKQQKVARDLKYNTHFTDLDALQRELGVTHPNGSGPSAEPVRGRSAPAATDDDAGDDVDDDADVDLDDVDDADGWNGAKR